MIGRSRPPLLTLLFGAASLFSAQAQEDAPSDTCIRHSPDKDIRRSPRMSDGFSEVITAVQCIETCDQRRQTDSDDPSNCQAAVHIEFPNATRTCQLYVRDTGSTNAVFRTAFAVPTDELFQRVGERYNLYEWIENCFPEPAWEQWGQWSDCDQPCSTPSLVGVRLRLRECQSVVRDGVTVLCPGLPEDKEQCNEFPCPAWGEWRTWAECSATCGSGRQTRDRACVLGQSFIFGDNVDEEQAEDKVRCDAQEGVWNETQDCTREDCPQLGPWNAWSQCDATCGIGLRFRDRPCLSLLFPCSGEAAEQETCTGPPCNEWGGWEEWGSCSQTCGPGIRTRIRGCDNEATAPCPGSAEERELCDSVDCPTFTRWAAWAPCSSSCGGGIRLQTRDCIVEGRTLSAPLCPFSASAELVREEPCNLSPCPSWREWTEWGACSASCGAGTAERRRSCGAGGSCGDGVGREERVCDGGLCPSWATWKAWAPCSKTCGIGFRTRSRSCGNGILCDGTSTVTEACDEGECPSWGHWEPWGRCSLSCGGGSRDRRRQCQVLNTVEDPGLCAGSGRETSPCNAQSCMAWGGWGSWGRCSAECSLGTLKRHRSCEGGRSCAGGGEETRQCDAGPCAYWSGWGSWESCSVSCGRGRKTARRGCEGGTPSDCSGEATKSLQCDAGECSSWANWGSWAQCSTTCGDGIRQRHRMCTGYACVGKALEVDPCVQPDCPSEPSWSSWSSYSPCSSTCGSDYQERTRSCMGGGGCVGSYRDMQPCPGSPCASWSSWGPWGACSSRCGAGRRTRVRACDGGSCGGPAEESADCEGDDGCWPIWSDWGRWSSCVGRCGSGVQLRRRKCLGGRGSDCAGDYHERKSCEPPHCSQRRTTPIRQSYEGPSPHIPAPPAPRSYPHRFNFKN